MTQQPLGSGTGYFLPGCGFQPWLRRMGWGWGLILLFLLAVPADLIRANSEPIPCHPQQPVHVQLALAGAQVRAHLHTAQTRVPDSRRSTQVLFRLPPDLRPPLTVRRKLMVQARQADCSPDPRHPAPYPISLIVTPEGIVQYDPDGGWNSLRYLAYDGELVWGTSLKANDQVVLDLLENQWSVDLGADHQRHVLQRVTWDLSGQVSELRLNHASLTAVPPVLAELVHLHTLILWGNELQDLPPVLSALSNLHTLELTTNYLTALPPELGQLSNLHTLDLANNHLTALPPELGQLSNLHTLELSYNHLTALPPELGQLSNLHTLDLSYNPLTALPPELGQLSNLHTLTLNANSFTAWPLVLEELKSLRSLSLSRNPLTGSINPALAQLDQLENLGLSGNGLTGAIPPALAQLRHLKWLDLSDNALSGPIPPELSQLTQLQDLILAWNQLHGEIPPELGQLTNLISLHLGRNQLTGPIPPQLGQLTQLVFFRLEDNQLTGPIPDTLGNLTNVHLFSLDGNHLTGCLPARLQAARVFAKQSPNAQGEAYSPPSCADRPGGIPSLNLHQPEIRAAWTTVCDAFLVIHGDPAS